MNKLPHSYYQEHFIKYINAHEIRGLVGSLGHTLNQKYRHQKLVMIGILKGCHLFFADLVREMHEVDVRVDFIKLGQKGREQGRMGTIILEKDISCDVFDQHVVVVKDIIDAGQSLHFFLQRLRLSQPKSLELMTLFDKPDKRTVPLAPDYVGKKIDDHFVMGFGLDVDELGRNCPDLHFLKYPN